MPTLKTLEKRRAERVEMVRDLLKYHAEAKASGRMQLSELELVLFRLGCSIAEGEKLIALAKSEHDTVKDTAGSGYERWTCRSCSSVCLRAPHHSDVAWSLKLAEWRKAHPAKEEPVAPAKQVS